ncbi:MAG: glycosyltransferase family 4 protein [Candidatus Bathycorpusculaceae bacterium]
MKIAIITKSMVLGYGIDEVVNVLSKELLKIGHEVTVFTNEFNFPLNNSRVNIKKLQLLRLSFFNDYWQRHFLVDVRSINTFLKVLKKYDIIMTCDPMHLVGAIAKIRYRKPVIMYFFGITPYNVLDSLERKIEIFRQTLTWNSSFYLADYIITNSKYTKGMLPKNLREKALVNYHGIEHLIGEINAAKQFRKQLEVGEKKLILSIGRFSTPYKGMLDIAKIFAKLQKKRDDVALLLVGGGGIPKDISNLMPMKNVHILTNIPYSTLKLCLAASDIYCTASRWEGFNIPLVAAQANQKPVVAFKVGAHLEVTIDGETGFLVVEDYMEFIRRLELLLDDDSLRMKMGENAAKFARKFSWQKSINTLKLLIESLAKSRFNQME